LIIRALFFRKKLQIKQSNVIKGFAGTVYLPANNQGENSDAKIFNFENNQVMSVLSSEATFVKKINDYNRFHDFFPLPTLVRQDKEGLLIVEELIEYAPNNTWLKEGNVFFQMISLSAILNILLTARIVMTFL